MKNVFPHLFHVSPKNILHCMELHEHWLMNNAHGSMSVLYAFCDSNGAKHDKFNPK